ncbi:uncharacterized protein LOC119686415 [Teleopsis dalmanni]|uniref:uncharacterized protein LOC119686415 n=1 Tax=Teleopsis dalmanni TaxID=139649 RepID=UPI000D32A9CC|nr:uncharacterized protein LOC119686415 [Teleopsis dalmanni]
MHRVRRRLKFGAQPTLNLDHSVATNPYCESPDSNIRKCAIQACPATEPPNTLFSFPQDDQKRLEWIKACGMESESQTSPLFICAEHFEPHMIMENKLKCNAFPKQHEVLFKKEQEIDIVDCEQLEDSKISEDVNNSSNRGYCNNCASYKKENEKERTLNKVKSQEITKLKKRIVQLQAEIEMWRDMVREATEDALYADNIVI